jgi:hypothetical protein
MAVGKDMRRGLMTVDDWDANWDFLSVAQKDSIEAGMMANNWVALTV